MTPFRLALALLLLAALPSRAAQAVVPEPIVIRGFLFEDRDGDGVQDEDEHGIPGWQFSLGPFARLGFPSHGATTDASGHFTLLMPYTDMVARSFRLLLLPEPPQTPEGYAWVVTHRSSGLNAIPIALTVGSAERGDNLQPGEVFEVTMGAQLLDDSLRHNVPLGRIPNGREPPRPLITEPRP
jgi:hypothetical protein